MQRIAFFTAVCVAMLAPSAAQPGDESVIREERAVQVAGASEIWRLEWRRPPRPVCAADDPLWYTCPCMGFEFGEAGQLDLVRLRADREIDRLPLTPLFAHRNGDLGAFPVGPAALRRFPVLDSDREQLDPDSVSKRAPVRVLDLHDFNRDGWATEFVLQIGTLPCGKRESVVVGVGPGQRTLHAFASADHPEKPLVLYANHWESLRTANGSVRLVAWECGDHGSEAREEIVLTVDAKGIRAARETFSCGVAGTHHGPLLSHENL